MKKKSNKSERNLKMKKIAAQVIQRNYEGLKKLSKN